VQDVQRFLVVECGTAAPKVIDAQRCVDGDRFFWAQTFLLNVRDEMFIGFAGFSNADESDMAAKDLAGTKAPARIMGKLNAALICLIDSGGMFDGGEGFAL